MEARRQGGKEGSATPLPDSAPSGPAFVAIFIAHSITIQDSNDSERVLARLTNRGVAR
jgi:hypothetical protein